jgi:hypothetical protein
MNCQHETLDIVSEPFLKGFTDFVAVECLTCFANFDVEYKGA